MEEDFAEVVEDIRIRLRLTVYVARHYCMGVYHEEFLARYGVCRDE
jgi:hypothetical protein